MNTKYDELFCLLSRQYDLTPLQAEMDEIITACSPFYAAEIARLEAEKAELIDWLKEAIIQLNYMQQKFGETGSGNAVISRISALLETYGRK